MTSQINSKPASSRQIGYLRKLQAEAGGADQAIPPDLNSWQASHMIAELISRKQDTEFQPADSLQPRTVNHIRLGLAMKMCFRLWTGRGHDVWDENRDAFKRRVIATYNLFTEIAETMDREIPASPVRRG